MSVHWSPSRGYYKRKIRPWVKVTGVILVIMGLIAFAIALG